MEHLQLTAQCPAPAVVSLWHLLSNLSSTQRWCWRLRSSVLLCSMQVQQYPREIIGIICEVFGVFLSQLNTSDPHSPSRMSSHLVPLKDASINSHRITPCSGMTSGQWIRAKCQYGLLAQFEAQTRCFPGWAEEYHANVGNGNCYVA